MGRTHTEQKLLARKIEAAKSKVTIGAKYRHHKSIDKEYTVVGFGFLEANEELCVIYQAEYGERLTFVRPLSVWLETVEWENKRVPRFSKI